MGGILGGGSQPAPAAAPGPLPPPPDKTDADVQSAAAYQRRRFFNGSSATGTALNGNALGVPSTTGSTAVRMLGGGS